MGKKDLLKDLLESLDDDATEIPVTDCEENVFETTTTPEEATKILDSLQPKETPSWYKTGDSATNYAKQKAVSVQLKKERTVPYFHLKLGEEATVVFVDDKGFGIHQHKIKFGDRWITITCVKDFAPCPICATGNRSSYVIYYTAIDTRPYTNKDGQVIKFRKVLFPATGSTLQMRLADEKENKKTLVGAVLRFKRYGEKESSSGTLIENKGVINISEKFGKEYTQPIDYLKVLAPPTEEELESFGFKLSIAGRDDILGDLDV